MKPNFSLDTMTTEDELRELINLALERMYQFGVTNGERTTYEGQADWISLHQQWLEKIMEKVDQFFLDNR